MGKVEIIQKAVSGGDGRSGVFKCSINVRHERRMDAGGKDKKKAGWGDFGFTYISPVKKNYVIAMPWPKNHRQSSNRVGERKRVRARFLSLPHFLSCVFSF